MIIGICAHSLIVDSLHSAMLVAFCHRVLSSFMHGLDFLAMTPGSLTIIEMPQGTASDFVTSC